MPQIWMTYDEFAYLLGCATETARAQAMHRSLDRKKSRNGSTRVKLELKWTARFIAAIHGADPALDQALSASCGASAMRCLAVDARLGASQLSTGPTSRLKPGGNLSLTAASRPARKTGAVLQKSRSVLDA
jgi:hypothetical protein